uniref:Secreted protein n=1 Tax=Mycena chlorophos TaxID=658473 RepID=A0ABQ0L487_MYCCL|nr:predicted protein [Mycena chlorophos]
MVGRSTSSKTPTSFAVLIIFPSSLGSFFFPACLRVTACQFCRKGISVLSAKKAHAGLCCGSRSRSRTFFPPASIGSISASRDTSVPFPSAMYLPITRVSLFSTSGAIPFACVWNCVMAPTVACTWWRRASIVGWR